METLKEGSRLHGATLRAIRTTPIVQSQGVVLCNVKNERQLLPHFLNHYRSVGVSRFAFVDNGSSDGTLAFLLDQADCDVFQHLGNLKAALFGMAWKNHLLSRYADAAWCFSADVDEHAVHDGWPAISLDEFAARLRETGRCAATAVMVDMYGRDAIANTRVAGSRRLLDACPYFDGDGYRIAMPADWRTSHFPRLDVRGGPLRRVFGSDGPGWLAKTPLILEPDIVFNDPHTVLPPILNFDLPTIALLHFRLTDLLAQRLARVSDQAYTQGSLGEYQDLGLKLREDPDFTFYYSGSVRFQSFERFIEKAVICGVLRPPGGNRPA